MASTVIGLFNTHSEAQKAVQALIDFGVSPKDISLVANDSRGEFKNYSVDAQGNKGAEGAATGAVSGGVLGGALGLLVGIGALAIPGIGPVLAAGPLAAALGTAGATAAATAAAGAGIGAASGGLLGGLAGLGVSDEDANVYAEGVRRGGTLVTAQVNSNSADKAAKLMRDYGAVDIHGRGTEWRQSGWSRFDANAKPYSVDEISAFQSGPAVARTETHTSQARVQDQGATVLPVAEEQLNVEKRTVDKGAVRVTTTVEERPVEEKVTLREEHVNVERRPVDSTSNVAHADLFQEKTVEVSQKAEQAVVNKTVRVIEEVVISKGVQERTETIRDTVRRQDVNVEQATATGGTRSASYASFDTDYRSDFDKHYSKSGYTYEQYAPVYHYGYELATNENYRGRKWADIEADARKNWETSNPDSWNDFKNAIRYAWDRAQSATR